MSGFRIFQDSHYVSVLNYEGYIGFTYFRKDDIVLNRHQDAIREGS